MASPLPIIFTLLTLVTPTLASIPVNTSAIIQKLTVDFYKTKCPQVEKIVTDILKKNVAKDRGYLPGIIRLHFHDCFVTGCDGSILVTPEKYNYYDSEMSHPANGNSLRGAKVIEEIKTELEKQCPNTVSCADILAYAARDAIVIAGNPHYTIPAGRRDGSKIDGDFAEGLPKGTSTIELLTEQYAAKGLTLDDLVVLEGSHSIGQTRCQGTISDTHRGAFEHLPEVAKSVDKKFTAAVTQKYCPITMTSVFWNITAPLNPEKLDASWGVSFYQNMLKGKGVIPADLAMATNVNTRKFVKQYAGNANLWKKKFNAAMVKIGKINVLTGKEGDIRRQCGILNHVNMIPASH